jgi:putative methionine-R-sulfoxide reductase with GAF domain
MIALPIRETGDLFRSALTLLSGTHKFTAGDLRTLQNLGAEEVLQAADAALERASANAQRELKDDLNNAPSARAIAECLAKGAVRCFGWEYGGVFRVDRARSCFVLFAEHVKNKRNLLVQETGSKKEYTQSLSAGMLGSCLSKRSILVVPDVTDRERNHGFIRTAPDQRSAMTVPLFVNGEIEMILDLESAELNAFVGPDLEAARGLAADCEQIFAARWHQVIERALMNRIEQAAVIVDAVGTIRDMNAAAETVFGQARNRLLASFGARKEDRTELSRSGIEHRLRIRLSVGTGTDLPPVEVTALADHNPLYDDYGHQLWLFTRLDDQSRESDWQYLEETVTAVARETRAPLLMADGLLRGAVSLLRKPELINKCAKLLDQAANHLLKADLTFERLSDRLVVQQAPQEAPTRFDVLATLYHEIDNLPLDDREAIDVSDTTEPAALLLVNGWPERLSFAFRSALSSLLMLRATSTDKLTVEIAERPRGHLNVRLCLPAAAAEIRETPAADPIERSQIRARRMASFAVEAIDKAIGQHGGTLIQHGSSEFEVNLPLCKQEGAP